MDQKTRISRSHSYFISFWCSGTKICHRPFNSKMGIPMLRPASLHLFHIFGYPHWHLYWVTIHDFWFGRMALETNEKLSRVRNLGVSLIKSKSAILCIPVTDLIVRWWPFGTVKEVRESDDRADAFWIQLLDRRGQWHFSRRSIALNKLCSTTWNTSPRVSMDKPK
jgi:hypothetical protein